MVHPHLHDPEVPYVSVSCPRAPDEQGTELDLPPRPHASMPVLSDSRSPSPGAAGVALRENSSLEQDLPPLCAWSSQCCVSSPVRGLKAQCQDSGIPFLSLSIQCSRNCSGGFQIREIQCVDSRDHQSLRPFHCQFLAGIPPPLSMSCNVEPCGEWRAEPWSQVRPLDTPAHNCTNVALCVTMCV